MLQAYHGKSCFKKSGASSLLYPCLTYLSISSLSFKSSHQASAILVSRKEYRKAFCVCLAALGHVAAFGHEQFFFPTRKKEKLVAAFGWVVNAILIWFHLPLVSFYFYFTFYFHLLLFQKEKWEINQNEKNITKPIPRSLNIFNGSSRPP